jgi:hypothetical protein
MVKKILTLPKCGILVFAAPREFPQDHCDM